MKGNEKFPDPEGGEIHRWVNSLYELLLPPGQGISPSIYELFIQEFLIQGYI